VNCNDIDLYGASITAISIGFGDNDTIVLTIVDSDTGEEIDLADKTVKMYLYQPNGKEVVALDGVIDTLENTVSFTFDDAFWAKLRENGTYTYKAKYTGDDITKTFMASNFNLR
jgi:hypothetical protein